VVGTLFVCSGGTGQSGSADGTLIVLSLSRTATGASMRWMALRQLPGWDSRAGTGTGREFAVLRLTKQESPTRHQRLLSGRPVLSFRV